MAYHSYTEVGRRTLSALGMSAVEVMFGCTCQKYTDVVGEKTAREAVAEAKRMARRHAAVAEAPTSQAWRVAGQV